MGEDDEDAGVDLAGVQAPKLGVDVIDREADEAPIECGLVLESLAPEVEGEIAKPSSLAPHRSTVGADPAGVRSACDLLDWLVLSGTERPERFPFCDDAAG